MEELVRPAQQTNKPFLGKGVGLEPTADKGAHFVDLFQILAVQRGQVQIRARVADVCILSVCAEDVCGNTSARAVTRTV